MSSFSVPKFEEVPFRLSERHAEVVVDSARRAGLRVAAPLVGERSFRTDQASGCGLTPESGAVLYWRKCGIPLDCRARLKIGRWIGNWETDWLSSDRTLV